MSAMTPEQIRRLRRQLNLTLEQMAQRVGVTRKTLSRWEKGEVTPHKLALEKLRSLA